MLLKFINKDSIFINPSIKTKDELFEFMSKKSFKKGLITNAEEFKNGLIKREAQGSTELKPGIAIPHVKSDIVNEIFIMIAIFKKGIKFTPGFGKGAEIIFLIGAPKMENKYINVLGAIARLIDKDDFIKEFKKANVVEDIIYALKKYSITDKTLEKGKTNYLITLSLNTNFSLKSILAIFLELGIQQPVHFTGENLSTKNHFGLSFFGFSAVDVKKPLTENKTIQGISEDKDAVIKLYKLLKEEGINLDSPGIGSLFSIELHNSFGGINPEIEF
ncbi:MAG: PTS sugar transporter subunit IIA [Spirochaetes bacterium]|nr:PTS sugar transporter subunit IIA [Spirochaetota bacterium]